MSRRPLFVFAVTAVVALGCEEKKTEPPAPSAPTPAAPAPSAPAAAAAPATDHGTVAGVVVVTGKLPAMPELKRNSDAFCAKKQMKDEEVVADAKGHLANVLVRVNGLPATPPPKEKVTLSQDDCMYRPRVLGLVAGQPLDIRNGDPVLHNVHGYDGARTTFNVAQVPNTPNIEKTFTQSGTLLKLKCDIHQWMTAYIWVQNNSAFAVSDKDGKFEIKDVPVGTWEIEAWHERFGSKKGKVTVAKDKTTEVKLDFNAAQTAAK